MHRMGGPFTLYREYVYGSACLPVIQSKIGLLYICGAVILSQAR